MNVRELIEKLQDLDMPDAEVQIIRDTGYFMFWSTICEVWIHEEDDKEKVVRLGDWINETD